MHTKADVMRGPLRGIGTTGGQDQSCNDERQQCGPHGVGHGAQRNRPLLQPHCVVCMFERVGHGNNSPHRLGTRADSLLLRAELHAGFVHTE